MGFSPLQTMFVNNGYKNKNAHERAFLFLYSNQYEIMRLQFVFQCKKDCLTSLWIRSHFNTRAIQQLHHKFFQYLEELLSPGFG